MSDIALSANGVPGLRRAERLLGDERLAKLAGRGDARAFATLYERHHQAIYRYCRSIVGNDHDAQDALQNAMMRAYAALARQERDLAVKPWLFRIAHNEAVTVLRRRRPELELSEDVPHHDTGLEGRLETRERLAQLVADLQSLPERQRGALVMRELSGLSMREIAQALSISPGAAKQTLFEARSSLHELAEGRAMECEAVRAAISARDGRVLRGRRIRAHLRACDECQMFRETIGARHADLRAIAPPLPAAAAGSILLKLLSHGGGGHAGGAAAAYGATTAGSGTSLGGHAALSLAAKGLAGVAVMAAATAGTVHLATGGRHTGHRQSHPVAIAHRATTAARHSSTAGSDTTGLASGRAFTGLAAGKPTATGAQGAAPSTVSPTSGPTSRTHGGTPIDRRAPTTGPRNAPNAHKGAGDHGNGQGQAPTRAHAAPKGSAGHGQGRPHSGHAQPIPVHHPSPHRRSHSAHGEAQRSGGHGTAAGTNGRAGQGSGKPGTGAPQNQPRVTASEAQASSSSASAPK